MVKPLADQMVDLSRKVLTFLFPPVTPARKKRGRKTDPQTRGFPPRKDSSRRPSILPPEKSRAAASIVLEKSSSEIVKGLIYFVFAVLVATVLDAIFANSGISFSISANDFSP